MMYKHMMYTLPQHTLLFNPSKVINTHAYTYAYTYTYTYTYKSI